MYLYKIVFNVYGREHNYYVLAGNVWEAINKAEDISVEYPFYIQRVYNSKEEK